MSDWWRYNTQEGAPGDGRPALGASDPGDTVGWLWEEPAELANGAVGIRLLLGCANAAEWSGATVHGSPDGLSYRRFWQTAYRTPIGTITAPLAAGAADWQPGESITIELSASPGVLISVSEEALRAGANMALIGDEIVTFQQATLTGANTYTLTGLLRAWYDCDREAHIAGERFVILTPAQSSFEVPESYIDETWYWKAASVNLGGVEQSLALCAEYALILTGRGLHLEFQKGRTKQYIAGEALSEGQHVYLNTADLRVYKAVVGSSPRLGLVQRPGLPVAAGEKVYIQHDGLMSCPTEPTPAGADWTWTPGAYLYGSAVAGGLSHTPDGQRPVALCLDTAYTILIFAPRLHRPKIRYVAPNGAAYTDPRAAIHDCQAGDTVEIAAGTYNIADTIQIPASNVTIKGDNRGGVILNFTTADANDCVQTAAGLSNIRIESITIQAVAGKTGYGLWLYAVTDAFVERVKVSGAGLGRGIYASGGSRHTYTYCLLQDLPAYGFYIYNVPFTSILNCHLASVDGSSVFVRANSDDLVIRGCRIIVTQTVATTAVYVYDCDRIAIDSNKVHFVNSLAHVGIYLRAVGDGINTQNCIRGNVVRNTGDLGTGILLSAVALQNLDETLVANNSVFDFATGINVQNAETRETFVHGNKVATCTAGVADTGTNTNQQDQD